MFVWCNCTLAKMKWCCFKHYNHAAPDYIHIQTLNYEQNFNALIALHCPHYKCVWLNFIHAYKKYQYLQLHAETGVLDACTQ